MNKAKKFKSQAKIFFKKNKLVACPAFPKEKVFFNSKGLSHLFYKGSGKVFARPAKETKIRVELLPRALAVLRLMPLIQEESRFIDKKNRGQIINARGNLSKY